MESIGIIFDAKEGTLPPNEYWNDYTVYELNDEKYIKYKNNWNEIIRTLTSTDIPNIHMWTKGVLYNNSKDNYIKTGYENWAINNGVYEADSQNDAIFWGTM